MSADAWLTLIVTVGTIVLLALDRFPPALVMGGAVTALLVSGVINEKGALAGFANEAPVTVAALYILAGAAEITGALDGLTTRALGSDSGADESDRGYKRRLARILFPSMSASAFIANTPLVAMLAPRVLAWCERTGRSASRFLMPLSYAIIFGGCITLVGTSTNLVVSGLLRDAGLKPLDVFEITPAGLPIAVIGVTLIVLLSKRLLPLRSAPNESLRAMREFTVEMTVNQGSPMSGKTVSEAGLRNLQGVYLIEIERDGRAIAPVAPDEVLDDGDRLTFAGNVTRVLDLQRLPGLSSAEERHFTSVAKSLERRFYEAVVGESSPLVGRTLKEVEFRSHYAGAVIAIHRSGQRIQGKLGEVRLRTGDVLVIVADPAFWYRWTDHPDFLVVTPLFGRAPHRKEKAWIVQLLTLGMIVVAGTGLLSLLQASLVVAMALVVLGVITPAEAKRSVDLDVILLMATSFGLGIAMADSGLAKDIASLIVQWFHPLGDVGILGGVLIATMLMTELLSNNAAAVLMFPIAMATASTAGLQFRPFAIAILFGATLSFLTPIGYQANTLVCGMGGYRYRDFSRLGAPLTVATVIAVLILVPLIFPLR
ncbi:MAG: SLC13 family permease [Actinomycetota bacterium]